MSTDYSKVRGEVIDITPVESNKILSEFRLCNMVSDKWYDEKRMEQIMDIIKRNSIYLPVIVCNGEEITHKDLDEKELLLFQAMVNLHCTFKAFVIRNNSVLKERQSLIFDIPVPKDNTLFTEEDAKKLWPTMKNYKSVKALCLAVGGGYSVFKKHFEKEEIVKAINSYHTIVETVLDAVWHNGPARNVYNLAPFVRAYNKHPTRGDEILRAVTCFSHMMDSITNGKPLNKIYNNAFMKTFEDYCHWHKDNNVTKASAEKKAEASLYCAVALNAYLQKSTWVSDFRNTVIHKDPFEISTTKGQQIEMAI